MSFWTGLASRQIILSESVFSLSKAVNVWNKSARNVVGYTPEEVMGKNLVQEFITDDFKMAVQAVLDKALHGEETANASPCC